jgi:hypothetical protein
MADRQGALLPGRQPKERDQNMAKKKKPSTHDETDSVESGKTAFQPSPSLARESLELNLSEGQRLTLLKYAELPAQSLFRKSYTACFRGGRT